MSFTYSICYPDKKDIVYFNTPISGNEALSIAKNFNWEELLKLTQIIDQNNIFYNPSLDFKCLESQQNFCLTADLNKKNEVEFSLWYNRPKKIKRLFGLLGETEKMIVEDVWHYNLDEAIEYLTHFVNKNFQVVENLYK